jgi:hypothetical protein
MNVSDVTNTLELALQDRAVVIGVSLFTFDCYLPNDLVGAIAAETCFFAVLTPLRCGYHRYHSIARYECRASIAISAVRPPGSARSTGVQEHSHPCPCALECGSDVVPTDCSSFQKRRLVFTRPTTCVRHAPVRPDPCLFGRRQAAGRASLSFHERQPWRIGPNTRP